MNDRNRGREQSASERRRREGGGWSRDIANDRGRGGHYGPGGDRYTSETYTRDRDWSDEDRYQSDRDDGGQYGGDYGDSRLSQSHFGGGQYEQSGQYWPGQSGWSGGRGASQFGHGQYDYTGRHARRGSNDGSAWGGDALPSGSQPNYSGRGPKGYHRSDDRLKELASDALMDDPQVDASEITLEVSGGEATLTGTVNTRGEKRAAEACVERVSGIREVINQLRVNRGDRPAGASSRGPSS